jgi:ribosomal protein S18 acetylase RimI-like enzyme
MEAVEYSIAGSAHIPALARIHYNALHEDYLPSLGLDYLDRVYYPAALDSEHAVTVIALVGGKPVGFSTIAHNSGRFTSDVTAGRYPTLARYALRAALRSPNHLLKSVQVAWSSLHSKPDPVPAEIVFIAVDAEYQGRGIGKELVLQSLAYVKQQGMSYCRTKTLAENAHVIRMYTRMGWHVREHFRLIGKEYVTIVSGPIL